MSKMKLSLQERTISEWEPEEALPEAVQTLLAQSLFLEQDGQYPSSSLNEINTNFLGMMSTGRDFRSLKSQVRVRLRWMLLPAVLGICVSAGIAQWAVNREFIQGVPASWAGSLNHAPVSDTSPQSAVPEPPPIPELPASSKTFGGSPQKGKRNDAR